MPLDESNGNDYIILTARLARFSEPQRAPWAVATSRTQAKKDGSGKIHRLILGRCVSEEQVAQ